MVFHCRVIWVCDLVEEGCAVGNSFFRQGPRGTNHFVKIKPRHAESKNMQEIFPNSHHIMIIGRVF